MNNNPGNTTPKHLAAKKLYRRGFLFVIAAVLLMSTTLPPTVAVKKYTVVIDPGHGGSDPGNLGTGRLSRTEKDISLDVALLVGEYIHSNYPEVDIVYTRKTDIFPTLARRVQIANESLADLFISIHCNANDNKAASGAETFVMGLHKSEESLRTAMRENASIYLEKDHEKNYQGFDPKNPDTYIIMSMRENAFLDKSINLAKNVQDQFRSKVGRKDRGVKQAGYYVISFTNMPSVLVELGFLTNAEEEDFLHSKEGKTYMASAIYRAFRDFKEKDTPNVKGKADSVKGKQEDSKPKENNPTTAAKNNAAAAAVSETNTVKNPNSTAQNPAISQPHAAVDIPSKPITSGIKFQVQILSSAKPLNTATPEFKGLKNVEEQLHNGMYKYLTGSTDDYAEAKQSRDKLIGIGFKDAFIIAFEDNQRIDLTKAVNQTKKK
jgi:N-acetylmuramoyl-L-alanine amidase